MTRPPSAPEPSERVLAIDPGPTQSAWVLLVDGKPQHFATMGEMEKVA